MENEAERQHRDRLLAELERLREQQTEAIVVLSHFLHEVCAQLLQNQQSTLAGQMRADLEHYAKQPDLDLITVVQQVRRFVDEVVDSLVHDASTLRTEKAALQEQLRLSRLTLHEVRHLDEDVQQLRAQVSCPALCLLLPAQNSSVCHCFVHH